MALVEEVSGASAAEDAGRTRAAATDVSSNDVADGRLFVVVMDDAQCPLDPFAARMARTAAIEFIRSLQPSDLVSVVFTWDIQEGQEFTSHHEKAIQAIERFRPADVRTLLAQIYAQRTLANVLASLSELSGRRRAVLLLSPGIVLNRENTFASFGSLGDDEGADADVDWGFQGSNVLRMIGREPQARIQVYSVDVRGLVAPYDIRSGMAWPVGAGSDSLKTHADNTGGVAITNTNDPLPAIRKVAAENASYHVVGYEPPPPDRKHTVKLSVRTKGALTLVRSYSAREETSTPSSSLTRAIAGFLPLSGVPVQVLTRTFPAPDSSGDLIVAVRAGMPPGEKTPAPALDVEWRVFDERKQVHFETRRIAAPDLVTTATGSTLFLRTRLGSGRYHVRIGVKGDSWRSAASVYGDIRIPEYGRKAFVSDVVLFSSTRRVASPQAVADLMPSLPDLNRVFTVGEAIVASAALTVPSNTSPRVVAVDMVNEGGRTVFTRREDATAECARVCGYSVSVPTEAFAPGRYLVRFTVRAGKNASATEASFTIRK